MSTPYIVSARKYRPATFRSVVGQSALTTTLKNAIETDRLAQAYLFCGPRGVGKTSCARIFAKTINCEHRTAEGEACNECESCKAFNQGRSINVVELDAASNNGVDNIRTLNEQVRVPPQSGRYRVFIIDEVHMLSVGAFNAFLKTLEEPPSYVIFILATTEKHKVIPTILSRCQIYDFNRIGVNDIAEHLSYVAEQEGIRAEASALGVIARKADGAMRDALSIFDQVAASCQSDITYQGTIANLNVLDYEFYFRLVDAFLAGDVPTSLLIYKEIRDAGFDSLSFINGLGNHIRDLMVAATVQTLPLLEVSADVAERYKTQASKIKPKWAYAAMEQVNFCDLNYRTSGNKQFLVELTLIRLCQAGNPDGGDGPKTPNSVQPLKQPAAAPATVSASQQTSTPAPKPTPKPASQHPIADRKESSNAQPPKPTPTPVTPPATGVQHTVTKRRPSTVRISATAQPEPSTHRPEPAAVSQERSEPVHGVTQAVSQEKLMEGWQLFTERHPELQLLNATMRSCHPQPTEEGSHFTVAVDNPGQVDAFEDAKGILIPFLREHTGNEHLSLSIKVAEIGERPKVLTTREVFEKLLTENKAVRDALADLDASLAD